MYIQSDLYLFKLKFGTTKIINIGATFFINIKAESIRNYLRKKMI